jgi:hypothetical protein
MGDMECGRDGPLRSFDCRAVMIAHTRALDRFGVVGPACQWLMQTPAVNAQGTQLLGSVAPLDL